jgi:hypothetical protein
MQRMANVFEWQQGNQGGGHQTDVQHQAVSRMGGQHGWRPQAYKAAYGSHESQKAMPCSMQLLQYSCSFETSITAALLHRTLRRTCPAMHAQQLCCKLFTTAAETGQL